MTEVKQEVVSMEEISNKVVALTSFDITKAELVKKVEETSSVVVTDLRDPVQIAWAKKSRIALRDMEITIEKQGKSYRDVLTKASRTISSLEDELLEITGPEKERLKGIEDAAAALKLKDEQEAKLPERLAKLEEAGIEIRKDNDLEQGTAEYVVGLTDNEFGAYLNQCVANKLEDDRRKAADEAREKQEAEDARLAAERKKIDDERLASEAAAEAKRKEEQAKIDAENARLAAERKAIEDEKLRLKHEEEVRVAEAKAKEEGEKLAKEKAEKEKLEKEAEAQAEKERLAKEELMKPDREKLKTYALKLESTIEDADGLMLKSEETCKKLFEANKLVIQAIDYLTKE